MVQYLQEWRSARGRLSPGVCASRFVLTGPPFETPAGHPHTLHTHPAPAASHPSLLPQCRPRPITCLGELQPFPLLRITWAFALPPPPRSLSFSTIFTPLPTVTTGPLHRKHLTMFSIHYYSSSLGLLPLDIFSLLLSKVQLYIYVQLVPCLVFRW